MNLQELLKKLIWQENEMYNLYKLGETFATYERPEFIEVFRRIAEEELRHRKTLEDILSKRSLEDTKIIDYIEALSLEPMINDERAKPEDFEDLILDILIREKHSYELYKKLSNILDGSLAQIFKMMANEELKHAYQLKLLYEGM